MRVRGLGAKVAGAVFAQGFFFDLRVFFLKTSLKNSYINTLQNKDLRAISMFDLIVYKLNTFCVI